MDPNFLSQKPMSELKTMPFDVLYDSVQKQAQIHQHLLQDIRMPIPQIANKAHQHGASKSPALPQTTTNTKKRPAQNLLSPAPAVEPRYDMDTMNTMPNNVPLDSTLRRPQLV